MMHQWTRDEMREYEEYLDSLTEDEFEIELKFLETLGKAKQAGKQIVPYESEFLC